MVSDWITRFFARSGLLILVFFQLAGCAEFDRRGGVVSEAEDVILFQAHTKSHRLFRSFMLIGFLTAAARQAGHNEEDRSTIEGSLGGALKVAFEAYHCLHGDADSAKELELVPAKSSWLESALNTGRSVGTFKAKYYASPANCQFFDEKMARLDYALYRLALSTLFNEKTNAQLSIIRDKLIGEVPVLSPAAKAAIFTAKAAKDATNIVDDLLNLSFSSLGPTLILLPLYRDALEMNMWVIVDSMTRACHTGAADVVPNSSINGFVGADSQPTRSLTACEKRDYALWILNRGNGSLPLWRNFVRHLNYSDADVEAFTPHFMLVSRFIWRSCSNLTDGTRCNALIKGAYDYAISQSVAVSVSFDGNPTFKRTYSASRPSLTRTVRQRLLPPSQNATSPPAGRDPDPTGSIAKPDIPR